MSSVEGSRAQRWWPLVPGLLLALVALHQVFLAETANLNPWKGGGFGMFASTDHGSLRRVRAWSVADGSRERLSIPVALEGQALDVRQLPRERDLEEFARALHQHGGREHDASDDAQPSRKILVEVVRIRIDLDRALRDESLIAASLWPPSQTERRP